MSGLKRSVFRSAITGPIITLLLGVSAVGGLANNDTPSYNNGDCWQAGTNTTCTWNHLSIKGAVYFRAIDNFTGQGYAAYSTPIHAAVNAWNSAPGPQYYSFTAHSNDVWQYINVSHSGSNGLTDSLTAITWLCDYQTKACGDVYPSNPVEIWYTNLYLNATRLDTMGANAIQSATAHESGHGMGLWHNSVDSSSIMWPNLPGNLVPDASDWGTSPGCANGGHGTRCIYGG